MLLSKMRFDNSQYHPPHTGEQVEDKLVNYMFGNYYKGNLMENEFNFMFIYIFISGGYSIFLTI